jgi:acyl-CoA reductase-like NAD-dependent aldehyde dehydrogenase
MGTERANSTSSLQTCAALKRLYVHDSIHDQVCKELVEFARSVPMGDGLDEKNQLGPIQNKMQFDRVKELVDDARQKGGRVLLGGNPPGGPGYFYPVTFVTEVKEGMRLVDEEQFGPVLPIIRYSDVDSIIVRANDNSHGLGGSVWSADPVKARRLVQQMQCGTGWVNKHGGIQPNAPFGGVKQSGLGVEFGIEGLKEYTTVQTVYC